MQQTPPWTGAPVILPAGAVSVMPLASVGTGQQQAGRVQTGGVGGPRPRREPPNFIPAKVFLGGVSNDTNEESLRAYCAQWGEISDVHVMMGKGYAFVTFATVPTAQAFLEHREHYIDGRRVDAKAAVPRGQGGDRLTRKMFVGGLPEVTDAEFRAHFAAFGTITDCVVLRKPDGTSRGFGFVTYDDEVAVEKCLVMEHHMGGRRVDVKRAVNKEQEGGGGGMGGGTGGGMGMGGGMGGGGMGRGGGMQQMGSMQQRSDVDKTVEWVCAECGNSNQGWRHTCGRCKTRRVGGGGGNAGGGGGGGASAAGGGGAMAAMGGMPAGVIPASMLQGMIPAHLMATMLQNMQGMQGMQGMSGMAGNPMAAMGGMGMPGMMAMGPMAGMAGMPGMMSMAGMPGMDASSLAGGMAGMAGMAGSWPATMAGMAGMPSTAGMPGAAAAPTAGYGGGGYGGMGAAGASTAYGAADTSTYGGYGMAGVGASDAAASTGMGTAGDGGYGRMPSGRGAGASGAAAGQQRYRPY